MVRTLALCLAATLIVPLSAQGPTGSVVDGALALPVTRVVLYKGGIGYFEHVGTVTGSQQLSLQFTADQLDDVLKSLTTVDLGNGRVVGVGYESPTPVERQLQGIRLRLGTAATPLELFAALRGARLDVRTASGATLVGRLLSAERRARFRDARSVETEELTLITDRGDLVTVELGGGTRVRVADADLRQEVGRYLDVAGSGRERDARRMIITTAGVGSRQLFVSYISEAAVWKTSYRLVFPTGADRSPLLQGWAIVDNTGAQDWDNVELSLMAGAPQSFVQPLSQPLFARRPTVALPTGLLPTPQRHDPMLVAGPPRAASGSLQESVTVSGATPARGGIVGGVSGGVEGGLQAPAPLAASAQQRSLSAAPAVTAAEVGELFEYHLADRVTIRRNESALVPILQTDVVAERVTLWNPGMGARPLRAVWLTNSSALTLDAGSVSIVDGGAFAGEGLIGTVKAGERRLLSYASDLAVIVDMVRGNTRGRTVRVRVADGIIVKDWEEREGRIYTIRNDNREPRSVIIEHARRPQWTITGAVQPVESTTSAHRFQTMVPPNNTASLSVDEVRLGATQYTVADVTADQLMILTASGDQRAVLERVLQPVLDKRAEVSRLQADIAARRSEVASIAADQQRLRENMKALERSAGERRLLERYILQLDLQETRLAALNDELTKLGTTHENRQRQLADLIRSLTLDVSF